MSLRRTMYRVPLRSFLQSSGIGVVLIASVVSAAPIAEGSGKFLGNITNGAPAADYAEYWNQITLENGGKWGRVQPSDRNSFSWAQTDTAYNYCKSKGWPFKHHCFVWGKQQPRWVDSGNATAAVENYIKTFGERYPGTAFIDVVNEPLHEPPAYRGGLGGDGTTGWDWVVTVFEFARKYCPDAKLLINDFEIVNDLNVAVRYLGIIKILQEKDLIDGIGVQSHCFNLENFPVTTIKRVLDTLASTGLPLYSSEFDLTGDEDTQLVRYQTYFPLFWEHQAVRGVTLWGYTNNWMGGVIKSDGREYAALKWLRTYVDSIEVSSVRPVRPETAAGVSPDFVRAGSGAVRINLASPRPVSLSVINPIGRIVFRQPPLQGTAGENIIALPRVLSGRGVNVVVVKVAGFPAVRKLVPSP